MALFDCSFFSESLGITASMYVILPQETRTQIGMDSSAEKSNHPVLYLLHGLSDDHTIWLRRTSIERYAATYGLAVVMPAVNRSFYTDMKNGHKYWTFVSEELPELARSFFPLSRRREDNFVAGLSMGGYGAFKLGLTHPDRYAAAASLSGVLDLRQFAEDWEGEEYRRMFNANPEEFRYVFGGAGAIPGSGMDLFHLAEGLAESGRVQPKLFQCCGTEDFLYAHNTRFRDHARKLGLDLTYEEEPGTHEWGYWDAKIRRVLEWLPIKERIG